MSIRNPNGLNRNGNRNVPNRNGMWHGLNLHPNGTQNLRTINLLRAGPRGQRELAPSGELCRNCVFFRYVCRSVGRSVGRLILVGKKVAWSIGWAPGPIRPLVRSKKGLLISYSFSRAFGFRRSVDRSIDWCESWLVDRSVGQSVGFRR